MANPTPSTTPATGPPLAQRANPAPWLPLLAAALAAAAFVSMDATVKALSPRYGAVQLTFFRFASGLLFAALIWSWVRSPLPQGALWRMHLLRCALLLVTLVAYFYALTVLPLAQAVVIGYTAPIFISLLAMWVLHERPSRWIWAALCLGLAGTGVALWPQLRGGPSPQIWGLAAAALSAVTFSGVMVLARMQAQRDSLWTILLIQNLLPTVALAVPAAMVWQPLQTSDLPIIAMTGGLATVGLLAVTWAFKHIEASKAAPMEYTGLVWAGLLGYFVFGEVPTVYALASAALIVLGCLLLLRRG